ncbi:hypothetical protein [Xylophilus sp. ASV27]|uniref:hypothetical protein n=1 Tax=Xylophilus sp. ASV27 TaxID=2795129 RepID=UPI0018EC723C|nr:hypothetical protein [Xylophilus sp. ASV27]
MTEFITLLGQHRSSSDVVDVAARLGLNEVMDDPPSRQYLISRERGLDLLLEDDHVVAVQIFIQATRNFSAFSGALPLGLKRGMSQAEIHQVLGTPMESDLHDSKYSLPNTKAKLVVTFDDSTKIKYLSFEAA